MSQFACLLSCTLKKFARFSHESSVFAFAITSGQGGGNFCYLW